MPLGGIQVVDLATMNILSRDDLINQNFSRLKMISDDVTIGGIYFVKAFEERKGCKRYLRIVTTHQFVQSKLKNVVLILEPVLIGDCDCWKICGGPPSLDNVMCYDACTLNCGPQ